MLFLVIDANLPLHDEKAKKKIMLSCLHNHHKYLATKMKPLQRLDQAPCFLVRHYRQRNHSWETSNSSKFAIRSSCTGCQVKGISLGNQTNECGLIYICCRLQPVYRCTVDL
ncbi:hypothetical protein M9H77_34119 [Catharanthus roseus]|uniref:Uncharacterized protein n=1 Tax=Catharanthus roseus TaxID=4058 RepID=A0ACB9ZL45_CATRO|nr:hypothetical protein M9H77_34119 [Catharanthus roseus]